MSLQISYESPDVSKAAAALWIANVTGALTSLDARSDPGYHRIGLIVRKFTFDASYCVTKAVARKHILVGRMLLVHPLSQVGFQKGLGAILTVIHNRTVRRTTEKILDMAYFSQRDV